MYLVRYAKYRATSIPLFKSTTFLTLGSIQFPDYFTLVSGTVYRIDTRNWIIDNNILEARFIARKRRKTHRKSASRFHYFGDSVRRRELIFDRSRVRKGIIHCMNELNEVSSFPNSQSMIPWDLFIMLYILLQVGHS